MKLEVLRPTGASTGKHEEGGLKFNAQWNHRGQIRWHAGINSWHRGTMYYRATQAMPENLSSMLPKDS